MRKQISSYTLPSHENGTELQLSSEENFNSENEPCSIPLWQQFSTLHSNFRQDFSLCDHFAAGDMPPRNVYLQNVDGSEIVTDNSYATYEESRDPTDNLSVSRQSLDFNAYQNFSQYDCSGDTPSFYFQNVYYPHSIAGDNYMIYDDSARNPTGNLPFSGQSINGPYDPPIEDDIRCLSEPFQQCPLQYGIPTVTDYGTVVLLLRHLIRVDLTADGSVSVNNFPAVSVTTLNIGGSKCFVQHPNGRVFQDGQVVHMVTGNKRQLKISRRGVTFSCGLKSLAYIVDESGTKTTTAKFTDLSRDITTDIFYDGTVTNFENLQQESYKMVSEANYERLSNGSELWELGKIRVVQDRWGQVAVTQNDSGTTITTSPTIRRMAVESPSVSVTVSCYSKNYFNLKKGSCVVTSGFCGLTVRNHSQKAGLDRCGRLVLF